MTRNIPTRSCSSPRSCTCKRLTMAMMRVRDLSKSFTLHEQGGVVLSVLNNISLDVMAGECVVLRGASGSGKSTLLRSMYANYKPQSGSIEVCHQAVWLDILRAARGIVVVVRKRSLG